MRLGSKTRWSLVSQSVSSTFMPPTKPCVPSITMNFWWYEATLSPSMPRGSVMSTVCPGTGETTADSPSKVRDAASGLRCLTLSPNRNVSISNSNTPSVGFACPMNSNPSPGVLPRSRSSSSTL
jgi:hypothetical protein